MEVVRPLNLSRLSYFLPMEQTIFLLIFRLSFVFRRYEDLDIEVVESRLEDWKDILLRRLRTDAE